MFHRVIEFFEGRKDSFFIVFLLLFSFFAHTLWFSPWSILTDGDWLYWHVDTVRELWSSWGTWVGFSGMGGVNIQLPFNFFMVFWSFFVNAGLSFDQATKITFFIPIAIFSFIAPYMLAKKLGVQSQVAFVAALFYGTTTYGIANQPPIHFVYAILPILFLFFIRAFEKRTFSSWIIFGLIYATAVCYEVRIMYIVTMVFLLYFLFFYLKDTIFLMKYFLSIGVILIFLESFWLLPTILGGTSHEITAVANRGLFGDRLFDLQRAFTLSTWDWTGGLRNITFAPQPIGWQFWVLPIVLFFGLFFFGKKILRGPGMFFWVVLLLGILLAKQSSAPFFILYEWLYNNFPGLNLFREASKFYILIAFGYFGVLTFFLSQLKKRFSNKKIFYTTFFVFIIIFAWNAKPYISQEAKTLSISRQMNPDYFILNKFVLDQNEYFRTFWTPTSSKWGIVTNSYPKISNAEIIQSNWNKLDLGDTLFGKLSSEERITYVLSRSFSNQLLNVSSIKYVIVPIQDIENNEGFFKDYNERELFIDELNKLSYLKKIDIGTEELVVYENENYRPHIYITKDKETIQKNIPFEKIDFQFKNPTEYSISLKSISGPTYVNFSEKYHPDWKMRVGKFNWRDVLIQKDYFSPDIFHTENDAKLNSFLIDPEYIKKNFTKDEYHENPDGSIDLELTLYFKPQSYFYLGLIISGTTLVLCLGYLGYVSIQSRRRGLK